MLEDLIKQLIAALQENTAALKSAGSAPAVAGETAAARKKREAAEKEAADKAASEKAGPSLQDFRDLAVKIVDKNEGAQIEALAKEFGLARVTAAHGTDKAAEVYARLQKIWSKLDV
jgi:hypothetical protein